MQDENIATLIHNLPTDLIGQTRFARHFIYGPTTKLRRLRKELVAKLPMVHCDLNSDRILVLNATELTPTSLANAHSQMENLAMSHGLEYDGFEIVLEDIEVLPENKKSPPLDKAFKEGSYLRFALGNGNYGYVLFLGGNNTYGHIVDCLAISDSGDSLPAQLDAAKRLYHQPVTCSFDSNELGLVGPSEGFSLPIEVDFRVRHVGVDGLIHNDEMDKIYKEFGFSDSEISDGDNIENWKKLILRIFQAGKNLKRGVSYKTTAVLTKGRKIKWQDGPQIPEGTDPMPWDFSYSVRLDDLRAALRGEIDYFAIQEAIH